MLRAVLGFAVACIGVPAPASAMCDLHAIANRSIDESAKAILDFADIVGIGYVTTIDNADREQQIFEPVVLAKGESARFELVPVRIGRIIHYNESFAPIPGAPGTLAFAALKKTDEGYVYSECIAATWYRKPKGELLRAIFAQAAGIPRARDHPTRTTP